DHRDPDRGRCGGGYPPRPLVPPPLPPAHPGRAAEDAAYRPGPHRRPPRRGQYPPRLRPGGAHPAPAGRPAAGARPAARLRGRCGDAAAPRPSHGRQPHRPRQAARIAGAGRPRHHPPPGRHAGCAALRLRGAPAPGPSPRPRHLRAAAARPHAPGRRLPRQGIPRPRRREDLLGRRHPAAADRGGAHRHPARQARRPARRAHAGGRGPERGRPRRHRFPHPRFRPQPRRLAGAEAPYRPHPPAPRPLRGGARRPHPRRREIWRRRRPSRRAAERAPSPCPRPPPAAPGGRPAGSLRRPAAPYEGDLRLLRLRVPEDAEAAPPRRRPAL
ncbi:MAG: Ribosomal large subunit pseudouridine synthase C, partial [uncultured Craurococcus sp.]